MEKQCRDQVTWKKAIYRACNLWDRIAHHETRKHELKESEEKKRAAINSKLLDIIQTLSEGTKCKLKEVVAYEKQVKEIVDLFIEQYGIPQTIRKVEKDEEVNTLEETLSNMGDVAKVENESEKC